jgi:hypothetical protein
MIDGKKFTTKAAYLALQDNHSEDTTATIWNSRGCVKIFVGLVQLDKINTRKNLDCKRILDTLFCPRCPRIIEDRHHLFFGCPVAQTWDSTHQQVWQDI